MMDSAVASGRARPALPEREGLPDDERALGEAFRARYAGEVQDLVVHELLPSPKLTIIVVSYRAKDYLVECLDHLRGQTARGRIPYEVMLADSGGLEHLRDETRTRCHLDLRLRDGISLNAARNAAIAWARGEYVAVVDDDGLVAPTFVEVVARLFEDPAIAAIRGRIVPKDHPYFCTLADHYDRGDEIVDDTLETEGHMAIRRRVYFASGGFPDDLFGGEGVYILYRIQKAFPGMRVVYAPEMVMRHDYFHGWEHFVAKSRKFRSMWQDVTTVDPDPELPAWLERHHRTRRPRRALTTEQRVARRLLLWTRWAVTHAPDWMVGRR